ncbi:MAG TPA: lysophospholipid acyltransferase family protein [Gemmatimonadaceae bacterium]|nr:lysophospholipid acyltransferase family protein [Gemmatimonadaceae bacterium]
MRTPLVLLTIIVYTTILGSAVLIAAMFGVAEKAGGIYQRAMHTWCRAILKVAGVRLKVHDGDRMSETEGRVYISNHVSWFDIFALASVIPRYTWIAKAELRKLPMFGRAAEAAGIVFIDRDNRKAAFESYKLAAEDVRRGRSVIICPEGTRGRDYHLRPFKKGPFVLAIASGALIIPTLVYGTREVMPKGSFHIRSGTVHIHFLEPVPTQGYTYEDRAKVMEIVWSRMADAMQRLYGVQTSEHAVAPEGERKE